MHKKGQLKDESDYLKNEFLIHNKTYKIIGENTIFDPVIPNVPKEIRESPTNKYYVLFKENDFPIDALEAFNRIELNSKLTYREFNDSDLSKQIENILDRDIIYFKDFGFAIVTLDKYDFREFNLKEKSFAIIPETVYQVNTQTGQQPNTSKKPTPKPSWNISKVIGQIGVKNTLTGQGVNVAILDTGIYFNHPEFINRQITSHSFLGKTALDDHGHGTHCAGIIGGKGLSNVNTYFGIAPDVNLFICKILDNTKRGTQTNVILGIKWAVKQNCQLISLSVSKPNPSSKMYDPVYERVLSWAKSKDTLTVVAVGNDSHNRPNQFEAIGSPSDCPSAIAVTAINNNNQIYSLSNGANSTINQKVSFTAPGQDILSTWIIKKYINNTGFLTRSGTSFAAPHVVAILALYKQNNPQKKMKDIQKIAEKNAKKLNNITATDQGKGLIYLT